MDSIQEQIVKKIVAALTPIATVQRLHQDGVNLSVVPTILLKEGDVTVEEVVYPSVYRKMELFAVAITRQDGDAPSGGEILNAFVAQIEEALQQNRTWDGLAIQTDPPSYLAIELDAVTPHLSVGVRFEVSYQHLRVDPYHQ